MNERMGESINDHMSAKAEFMCGGPMKRCRGRKARKGLRRCNALGVGLKVPGILVPPGSSLGLAWKQVYRAVVLLLAPSMSSEEGLLRRFQVMVAAGREERAVF